MLIKFNYQNRDWKNNELVSSLELMTREESADDVLNNFMNFMLGIGYSPDTVNSCITEKAMEINTESIPDVDNIDLGRSTDDKLVLDDFDIIIDEEGALLLHEREVKVFKKFLEKAGATGTLVFIPTKED